MKGIWYFTGKLIVYRTTFFASKLELYQKTLRNMKMNFVSWPGIWIHLIKPFCLCLNMLSRQKTQYLVKTTETMKRNTTYLNGIRHLYRKSCQLPGQHSLPQGLNCTRKLWGICWYLCWLAWCLNSRYKAVLSLFKCVILTEDAISDEDDRNHERKYYVLKWHPSFLPENLVYTRTTFFASRIELYEKTLRKCW